MVTKGRDCEAAVWDQPCSGSRGSAGAGTTPAHRGAGVYPARG